MDLTPYYGENKIKDTYLKKIYKDSTYMLRGYTDKRLRNYLKRVSSVLPTIPHILNLYIKTIFENII